MLAVGRAGVFTARVSVVILAGPGGLVLVPGRPVDVLAERVAILTDPEGPMLVADLEKETRLQRVVAILTNREGPMLAGFGDRVPELVPVVAILTDTEGPMLGWSPCRRSCRCRRRCDPHRPRRADAGFRRLHHGSPLRVAILTDSEGPILAEITERLRRVVARVAILTDPGGPVLAWRPGPSAGGRRCCDPHRPRRTGAGCSRRTRRPASRRYFDPHRPRRSGASRPGPRRQGRRV